MDRKYELLDRKLGLYGYMVYRIKALRDFGDVKAGDLGGFIESETNLSHKGTCWIYKDACASGKSRVSANARIYGNSWICDHARVSDNALVYGDVLVCGHAQVSGNAIVHDYALVSAYVHVSGTAMICRKVNLVGKTKLSSGIWNGVVRINNLHYIISATLNRVLMEYD